MVYFLLSAVSSRIAIPLAAPCCPPRYCHFGNPRTASSSTSSSLLFVFSFLFFFFSSSSPHDSASQKPSIKSNSHHQTTTSILLFPHACLHFALSSPAALHRGLNFFHLPLFLYLDCFSSSSSSHSQNIPPNDIRDIFIIFLLSYSRAVLSVLFWTPFCFLL